MMVYAGEDVDEGERVIAPFRALAEPIVDMLKPMPYPQIYPPEEGDYHPTAVGRTMFLDTIKLPEAETLIEYLSTWRPRARRWRWRSCGCWEGLWLA